MKQNNLSIIIKVILKMEDDTSLSLQLIYISLVRLLFWLMR